MIHVGIDVSKAELAVEMLEGDTSRRFTFDNTPAGHKKLFARASAMKGEVRFCMESTGGYEFELAAHLAANGAYVSVENPARIKYFAIAMGFKNKTDRADAHTIALYSRIREPERWFLSDKELRELSQLSRHRFRLISELGRVNNWLEHRSSRPNLEVRQNQGLARQLNDSLKQVEEEFAWRVEANPALKAQLGALMQIKGVGPILAMTVLFELGPASRYGSAQQYAAAAGLSPCRCESGQFKGKTRISKAGNKWVRQAAHMPAIQAMRWNPSVKALCDRLAEKKLAAKQIIAAAARKLVMLCYGVLKALENGRQPFYAPSLETVKHPRKPPPTFRIRRNPLGLMVSKKDSLAGCQPQPTHDPIKRKRLSPAISP
jgi:transposase